ncbi:type II secretion system minor pseudopilin GspI [Arenicella chitinivorans]|nr:type II secretion system minor pseudopilin GspI [Arenicella chitinivorans]
MRTMTHRESGFTLLEVMIALIFVSLGIATVIEVTSQHVMNLSELEKRAMAGWVASNKVAEIQYEAKTSKVRTGNKNDRVKMGGMRWRTRAKIEKTEIERVFMLTVEVRDDEDVDRGLYAQVTTAITESN